METSENNLSARFITSRLIDLIIRLPEHEQLDLLAKLEERELEPIHQAARRPFRTTPYYASGSYVYWDLFG
jgi:hypothetical protein